MRTLRTLPMLAIFNDHSIISSPRCFQTTLFVLLLAFLLANSLKAQELEAVQVYSQDELIRLINLNQHLARIKEDRCQIVEDIEARAEIMHIPSFQFLWGDMLAWGVCVDANSEKGIHFYVKRQHKAYQRLLNNLDATIPKAS